MVKSEEVKKSPKSGSCPRYAPGTTAEPCLPCVITKTGLDIGRYICSVWFGLPVLWGELLPQPREPLLQVIIVLPGRAFRSLRTRRFLARHPLSPKSRLLSPDTGGNVAEALERTDLPLIHYLGQAVRVLEGALEDLLPLRDQPLQEVR